MLDLEKILKNKRILVVDDLVETRSSLKKMFIIFGAPKVDVALDGDDAIGFLSNNDYDIVISDYNLGKGKDGQQILEEARYMRWLKASSTFIMVTGENASDMVMGALEYHPDGYVTKPYTINSLRERMIRILTIKEQLQSIYSAVDREDYEVALEFCHQIAEDKPPLVIRCKRLEANIYIKQEKYQQALQLYDEILEIRPLFWAYLGQAICLYHLGKLEKAKNILLRLVKEHHQYVQGYDWLARTYIAMDRHKDAQQVFEKGAFISPKAILRQMELGNIALNNSSYEVAEKAFKKSIKLGKNSCYKSVNNYFNLTRVLLPRLNKSNDRETREAAKEFFSTLDEARIQFKEKYEDDEFKANVHLLECMANHNLGKDADAEMQLGMAEELYKGMDNPKPVKLSLALARGYNLLGKFEMTYHIVNALKKRQDLSTDELMELKAVNAEISEKHLRQYTTKINDEAVKLFERGDLRAAIDKFLTASGFKEAGISVLLNTAQAILTYVEEEGKGQKDLLPKCAHIFKRLGSLPRTDERFARFDKLKASYNELRERV